MYKQHATKVQAYAQQSADNMAWVILLVICSIRMNWLTVGDQLKDIKELKHDSRFLKNRTRAKAYKYISAHKHKMYGQMMAVINSHKNDKDARAMSLMKVFIRVPGLGLAKAGFVCQLCVGLVGCIDSHNLKLYGLDPRCLDYDKSIKNQALLAEKKRNYIEICHSYGTEFLWNKWCEHVATGSPHWIDGDHVSAVHYTYLKQGD